VVSGLKVNFTPLKRILTIFLAFLYLVVSSGFVMEIHHCMGQVAGSSFAAFDKLDGNCSHCGMPKGSNKCCKDELKLVKLSDEHKTLPSLVVPSLALPEIAVQHFEVAYAVLPENRAITLSCNDPPPASFPLFLRVRSLRI
jgi:hypothetical protein